MRNFVTFESNYVAETSVHQLHCHVQHVMSHIGHPNQWKLQLVSFAIIPLYTTSTQQHSCSIVLHYNIMSVNLLFIIIIRFADVYEYSNTYANHWAPILMLWKFKILILVTNLKLVEVLPHKSVYRVPFLYLKLYYRKPQT